MEIGKYSYNVNEFSSMLNKLISSDPITFFKALTTKEIKLNVEGVYIISTPNDSEIIYAGKTKSKSVLGRMKDHFSLKTDSDLRGMLKLFPSYPRDIDNYLIRCLEVPDARKRTFFEYFATGVLRSPFNK